jgi:hypothetical protein
LYFRTADEITADLRQAGFTGVTLESGWHGEPPTADAPMLVVRATK